MKTSELHTKEAAYRLQENIFKLHNDIINSVITHADSTVMNASIAPTYGFVMQEFNSLESHFSSQNIQKQALGKLKIRFDSYYNISNEMLEAMDQKESDEKFESLEALNLISSKMFGELNLFTESASAQFDERFDAIQEKMNKLWLNFLIFSILSMLAVGWLMYVFKSNLLKSLNNVTEGIDNLFLFLSRKIDHIDDITIVSRDELGRISEHINENIHEAEYLIATEREFQEKLAQDVRDKTEEITKNSHVLRQYKEAIDTATIVAIADKNGVLTYVNNAFCETMKASRGMVLGRKYESLFHPEFSDEKFDKMKEFIQQGEIWTGIVQHNRYDGKAIHLESTIFPMKNTQDQILEYVGIMMDVTPIVDLNHEIIATQKDIIEMLAQTAESKSKETGNHVRRVADYSRLLAEKYGLSKSEGELLHMVSPMHDVGKIGISDSILNKPGKLDDDEYETMKMHTQIGYDMLKKSDKYLLKSAAVVAIEHHEKYDGSGYPQGKSGDSIHIFGRITALADVFDALGTSRCYKQAWPMERICDYISDQKGRHFDPRLVDLFFANLESFIAIKEQYKD